MKRSSSAMPFGRLSASCGAHCDQGGDMRREDLENPRGIGILTDTSRADGVMASMPPSANWRGTFRSLRPSLWLPALVAVVVVATVWQVIALHNPYDLPRLG